MASFDSIIDRPAVALAIIFATAVIAAAFIAYRDLQSTYTYSAIVRVGGCDHQGFCGVMYENGYSDTVRFPVLGQVRKIKIDP